MNTSKALKKTNKKAPLVDIFILFIFIFFISHITPSLSVRTNLFFIGHPIIAFTTDIETDSSFKEAERENIKFYKSTKTPANKEPVDNTMTFKVKKVLFLYFSEFYD